MTGGCFSGPVLFSFESFSCCWLVGGSRRQLTTEKRGPATRWYRHHRALIGAASALAGSAAFAASKRRSNARPILNLGIGHGSCPHVSVPHRPLLDRPLVEGVLAAPVVSRIHHSTTLRSHPPPHAPD